MSLHVRAAGPEGLKFLAQALGLAVTSGFTAIEALHADTGHVVGMVGFDRWTDNSAEMHVWLAQPSATRALLWPAFHYLFEQQNRGVAIGVVAASNARALRMDKHVGFVEVARIKDGKAQGEDLVLLELRKENCKWLKRTTRRAA